jgi:hypothetical protein
MIGLRRNHVEGLFNAAGALVGFMGVDGKEYLVNTVGNSSGLNGTYPLINTGAVSFSGGTINGTTIGVTTPAIVKASDYQAPFTDISGTPGSGTINTPRGRAAIPAAGASILISNSLVTATSTVLVQIEGNDATLRSVSVTPSAGLITITAGQAPTGATNITFMVFN